MPDTYRDLAQCLAQAIGNLLSHRGPQGHWGDARSTALAVWALNEVISGRNAGADSLPELRATTRDATAWLVGQARREDGGYSWESEAWDTALAILALKAAGQNDLATAGRASLLRLQQPAGGWPETTRPPGGVSYAEHISTTAWALYALIETGPPMAY